LDKEGLTMVSGTASYVVLVSLPWLCFPLTPITDRRAKLLNTFTIVNFPNDVCTTNNNVYKQGTCYSRSECSSLGGTSSGTCATGFGVCCYFTGGCGGSTTINNTYFVSTTTDSSSCSFNVCRANSDICQIKLTFDKFTLAQPVTIESTDPTSSRTQCLDARFVATTNNVEPFTLCGENTGQHLYLEAKNDCNLLDFSWDAGTDRAWIIQTSQIHCTSEYKPPMGCSQYFTGTTGYIQSYNYDKGIHLANQHDKFCVRPEQGYCGIYWSAGTFKVGSYPTPASAPTITVGWTGTSCTSDYITIPAGGLYPWDQTQTAQDFCGAILSLASPSSTQATVFSAQLPFMVGFTTDGVELDELAPGTAAVEESDGFRLYWEQTKVNC